MSIILECQVDCKKHFGICGHFDLGWVKVFDTYAAAAFDFYKDVIFWLGSPSVTTAKPAAVKWASVKSAKCLFSRGCSSLFHNISIMNDLGPQTFLPITLRRGLFRPSLAFLKWCQSFGQSRYVVSVMIEKPNLSL